MNINKIIEKTYSGDAYILEVLKDKVILNDNYEGVIVLDSNLSIVKRISIDQDLCIYNAIVIDEKEILLNCIESKKIYIVNIDTDEIKMMEMPDCFYDEILDKKIADNGNDIVIKTYKNNYFYLDTDQLVVRPCDGCAPEDDFDNKELDEEWIDYVKSEDTEIYLSESQIKIVGSEEQYIYPDEDYYFCRLKAISMENQRHLMVLSSDDYNEKYKITIYNI